jgi:hypothetical protein
VALPRAALFQNAAPGQPARTTRHVDAVTGSRVLLTWNDTLCHRCARVGGPHGPLLALVEPRRAPAEWEREFDGRVTEIRDLVSGDVMGYEPRASYLGGRTVVRPDFGQYDFRKVDCSRTVDDIRDRCIDLAQFLRSVRKSDCSPYKSTCFGCGNAIYAAGLQLVEIAHIRVSLQCEDCQTKPRVTLWQPWEIPERYRIGVKLFTPADAFREDATKKRLVKKRHKTQAGDSGAWRGRVLQRTIADWRKPSSHKHVAQSTRLGREWNSLPNH